MVVEVPADTPRLADPNKLLPSSQQPGDCSWHPPDRQRNGDTGRSPSKSVTELGLIWGTRLQRLLP